MEGARNWQGQVAGGQGNSACQIVDARRQDPQDQGKPHWYAHCLAKLLRIAVDAKNAAKWLMQGQFNIILQHAVTAKFDAVMPGTKLQEHTGSDKAWVWSTMDFASEEQRMELFCLKLPSPASKTKHRVLNMCMLLHKACQHSEQSTVSSYVLTSVSVCVIQPNWKLLYRSARVQKVVWGGYAHEC